MINSLYIQDILLLLIDGHKDEFNLKHQIQLLNDNEYTYTGAGLIVSFNYSNSIDKYKIDIDEILNGVSIESSELECGAYANLFFDNGMISYLEIFSNSATYPEKMFNDYVLSQDWLPNSGRKIIFPT
jgi:hypothetical protein